MKVESRGKFPGVKLHLEPEEVEVILEHGDAPQYHDHVELGSLTGKIKKKILAIQKEVPNLLQERTPEQVLAILAKEAEKSALQLKIAEQGGDISKVDPEELKKALLKHVKEKK